MVAGVPTGMIVTIGWAGARSSWPVLAAARAAPVVAFPAPVQTKPAWFATLYAAPEILPAGISTGGFRLIGGHFVLFAYLSPYLLEAVHISSQESHLGDGGVRHGRNDRRLSPADCSSTSFHQVGYRADATSLSDGVSNDTTCNRVQHYFRRGADDLGLYQLDDITRRSELSSSRPIPQRQMPVSGSIYLPCT